MPRGAAGMRRTRAAGLRRPGRAACHKGTPPRHGPAAQIGAASPRPRANPFASALSSQIRLAHVVVLEQLAPGTGQRDAPGLHDVAARGDGERHLGVLLNQQDRGPRLVQLAHDVEDLLGTSDKSLAEHESIEVYSLSDGTTALLRYRDDQLLGAYLRDKDNVETSIFNQNNAGMTGINGTDSTIGGGADTNGSTNAVTGTDNTNGAGMGTDNTNGAGTGTDNGIGGDTDTGDTRMTTDLDNAADSATEASSESR